MKRNEFFRKAIGLVAGVFIPLGSILTLAQSHPANKNNEGMTARDSIKISNKNQNVDSLRVSKQDQNLDMFVPNRIIHKEKRADGK
jgi:hypothetical protein